MSRDAGRMEPPPASIASFPRRVLQFSKYYPPVDGGIETIAKELTEGLRHAGIVTDVLCSNLGRRTVREEGPSGRLVRAGTVLTLLKTPLSWALLRELRRHADDWDVIHLHAPNPMATLALWLARPSGHVVVHWHSDVIHQQRAMKWFAPLQEWLLRRASAIIATSPPYAAHSAWLRPWQSKLRVVPLGIYVRRMASREEDVQAGLLALRQRHGDRPLVFALGRMVPYKGFATLVEAAALLESDALVVVGGGGELLEPLRAQVRERGLEDRIRLVGRLDGADVEACLRTARAFCLPSTTRAEAFGIVMLEAMSAGLPVVATDIEGSGVPWVNVTGETGFNVPVGDAAAMARAIDRLVQDPALARRMGDAARRRYEACFTADRMVEATIALYRSLPPGGEAPLPPSATAPPRAR